MLIIANIRHYGCSKIGAFCRRWYRTSEWSSPHILSYLSYIPILLAKIYWNKEKLRRFLDWVIYLTVAGVHVWTAFTGEWATMGYPMWNCTAALHIEVAGSSLLPFTAIGYFGFYRVLKSCILISWLRSWELGLLLSCGIPVTLIM